MTTDRGNSTPPTQGTSRPSAWPATFDAALDEGTLTLRVETRNDPEWEGDACPDVAQEHSYSVAVAFTEAAVPDWIAVRHGDETILEGSV